MLTAQFLRRVSSYPYYCYSLMSSSYQRTLSINYDMKELIVISARCTSTWVAPTTRSLCCCCCSAWSCCCCWWWCGGVVLLEKPVSVSFPSSGLVWLRLTAAAGIDEIFKDQVKQLQLRHCCAGAGKQQYSRLSSNKPQTPELTHKEKQKLLHDFLKSMPRAN